MMFLNRGCGALWIDGVEVLDGGFRRARLTGGADSSGCGDSPIYFNPDEHPNPLEPQDPWDPLVAGDTVDDPVNPAPWYDEDLPESAKFHGFWHESMAGLVETPINRQVVELGGRFGGAAVGWAANAVRELTWTIWASADDQDGLDYGMRWLAQRLLGNPTDCEGSVAMLRLIPPVEGEPTKGLRLLRAVGLVQPPTFADPNTEDCTQVKIQFTLVVGDPCLYHYDGTAVDEVEVSLVECDASDEDEWECGPVTSQMVEGAVESTAIAKAGVIVEIENTGDTCTNDILITLWDDPTKIGLGIVANDPTGYIRVAPLPANSTGRVDTLRRQVTVDSGSGWVLRNDLILLQAGQTPYWLTSRPGGGLVARAAPASLAEIPPDGYTLRILKALKEGCAA